MSLRGYVKKGKPALWTSAFPRVAAVVKKVKKVAHGTNARGVLLREYKRRRDGWIADKCCAGCALRTGGWTPATECHHKFGRFGLLLTFEPGWVPLCSSCHRWTHDNPKTARELHLICEQGSWNSYKKALQSLPACV